MKSSSRLYFVPLFFIAWICTSFAILFLISDLIELSTNANEMPSSICAPASGIRLSLMFLRDIILVTTGLLAPALVSRTIEHELFLWLFKIWVIPLLVVNLGMIWLGSQFINTLRPTSMYCMGVPIFEIWGYPYGWLACPALDCVPPPGWSKSIDILNLLLTFIWLLNLGICALGLLYWIRRRKNCVVRTNSFFENKSTS